MTDEPAQTAWNLPQIRRLIDEAAMAPVLGRAVASVGATLHRVAVRRFLPHRRGRLVVEYDVQVTTSQSARSAHRHGGVLYLRAPMVEPAERWPFSVASAAERAHETDRSFDLCNCGLFYQDNELGVTIHSRDRDADLTHLADCLAAERIGETLGEFGPLVGSVVAYRAGRRFVVAYDRNTKPPTERVVMVKGFADDRAAKLAAAYQRVVKPIESQSNHRVRIPRLIRQVPEWRALLTEAVACASDNPASLAKSEQDTGCVARTLAAAAAEVLACIHNCSIPDLKEFDHERQQRTLRDWQKFIELAEGEISRPAAAAFGTFERAAGAYVPESATVIHGDFYEAQIAVAENGITLFDMDTVALGDPTFDVGNFLAHQWLWCLRHDLAFDDYLTLASDTVSRYELLRGPLSEPGLGYHWSAALLRVGAIHAFRAKTRRYAARVFDAAASVVERGRDLLPVGDRPCRDPGAARCA